MCGTELSDMAPWAIETTLGIPFKFNVTFTTSSADGNMVDIGFSLPIVCKYKILFF